MDMAIVLGSYASSARYTVFDPTAEEGWMVGQGEEPTGAYVVDVKRLKASMPMSK